MTVKISDSFKVTRKSHPNERHYNGRSTMENIRAFTQALECLEGDDFDKLCTGTLVYDEERTAELFDSILPGDIIGLCNNTKDIGWVGEQWKVLKVDAEADKLLCAARFNEQIVRDVFFEDISIGLLLGRAEILYRDGKPYGLPEDEMTFNVNILDLSKKDEETTEASPEQVAPADDLGTEQPQDVSESDESLKMETIESTPSVSLVGSKIWLLFHGLSGDLEQDTNPEVYANKSDALARESALKSSNSTNDDFFVVITETTIA